MSDLDYRKLLDAFSDAVVIGDRSGSIVYANPAVGKLLGWTREELLGRPLTQLIPHKLRSRHTAGFNRARSTRQHRVLGNTLRVPVLQANGMELSAEMVLSAFRGGAGEELFIATFRRSAAAMAATPASTRYLQGLAVISGQLQAEDHLTAFSRRLEVLASAHMGACGLRLWLAEASGELRLANRDRIAELGEPKSGVLTLSTSETLPALAARTRHLANGTREKTEIADPEWLDRHGIAATIAVPILDGETLLGVLHFLSGDSWSANLAQALPLLGELVAGALREGRRREQEHQQRAAMALGEALRVLAGEVAAQPPGTSAQPLLESLLASGIRLTGADEGSFVMRDLSTGELAVRACAGYKTPITGMVVPVGMGVTALVLESGEPVAVSDYQQFENALPRIRQRGVRAALGVPVRGPERLLGVLTLGTKRRDKKFTAGDLRTTQALANLASLVQREVAV